MLKKLWAKRLSLKIWKYLKDHPKITDKYDMPRKLSLKIRRLKGGCPLCEIFHKAIRINGVYIKGECPGCPLGSCKGSCNTHSDYSSWCNAETTGIRELAATAIYNKIKAWKVWK